MPFCEAVVYLKPELRRCHLWRFLSVHRFVVCSKMLSSNKHGLLSRVKVTRTPVELYGSDVSKIDFVP